MHDIRSEIRPLGVKDLKRDGVKAVQLKLKATAEEPKKINEAKNGGFEWKTECSQRANGRGLALKKDLPWTMDAPVMRIGSREVVDQYSGMQWMATTTSQLSRSGGVARRSKGSGVIRKKLCGSGRLWRGEVSTTLWAHSYATSELRL